MTNYTPSARAIRMELYAYIEQYVAFPVWSKVVGTVSSQISTRIVEDYVIEELRACYKW